MTGRTINRVYSWPTRTSDTSTAITRATRALLGLILLTSAVFVSAQTQTLTVQLVPAINITAPVNVPLSKAGAAFGIFSSPTVSLQFKIRNTQASGTGSITVQATEFLPANGPSIASGDLTYTCVAASVGIPCAGTQTLRTTATTPIVTGIPPGTCTGAACAGTNPQSVQLNFTLNNQPQYKTGTYSSVLTFTVSAT